MAIRPNNAQLLCERGAAWCEKGECDKAIADCNQALAIEPHNPEAYDRRGAARQKKGEYDQAIADENKALAIEPRDFRANYILALLYATCPDAKYRDAKKAVENAGVAKQMSGGKNWLVLGALAAAYAESGDFAKARDLEGKAIELAPEKWKPDYRSRLELYQQGKPYHEQPAKK